ncbi:MAG: proline dehydrogenase family protein [Moheibacter sp.]
MSLFDDTKTAFEFKSDQDLKKAHSLFRLISSPVLTKIGTLFFKIPFATKILFVKPIVRKTIYNQFVGGETTTECLYIAKELYQYKVGSIMDYSVEGQESEEEFDKVKDEILRLIKIAKENPKEIPFVVFKPTGFGKISLYEKVGKKSTLTEKETQRWSAIRARFEEVSKTAFEQDITLMVDAEESWMQDAVDDLVDEMMQRFNKEKCIICNTLQMYRHDRLAYLKKMYEKAEQENYMLGYKVVRGAYMEKERDRAEEYGYLSPIQPDKASTDRDYDLALEFIVQNRHRISLFAGTHNEKSSEWLTKLMLENNLEVSNHKIWFGQLFGMSDNISFKLSSLGYNVAKYLPYGPIKEVMPYLIRRAEENTSVAGQTGRELSLIMKEIKRRKETH